jgi:hypothetical protein
MSWSGKPIGINQKILRLLAYSFVEGKDIIPYSNLTDRERAIITEADYEIIHEMIRDGKLEIPTKSNGLSLLQCVGITVLTVIVFGIIKGIAHHYGLC